MPRRRLFNTELPLSLQQIVLHIARNYKDINLVELIIWMSNLSLNHIIELN